MRATGEAPLHSWWTLLADDKLNELIERVDAGSLELKSAYTRVLEARGYRVKLAGG